MGARVVLPAGRIESTFEPGVRVESDETTDPSVLRRLGFNPESPLYPYVVERLSWPKQGPAEAWLKPGHYVVESMRQPFGALRQRGDAFRYLVVTADGASWVSEARALEALGAVEVLQAMALDDAAVSLSMGDLDAARVQWLRRRDGDD